MVLVAGVLGAALTAPVRADAGAPPGALLGPRLSAPAPVLSPSSVTTGAPVAIRGTLAHSGPKLVRSVTLQVQRGGGWVTVVSGRTTKVAGYSFSISAPDSAGSYAYRVHAPRARVNLTSHGLNAARTLPAITTATSRLAVTSPTAPPPPADATPPPVPTGLSAAPGDGTVDLSWTAVGGTPDLAGYQVYRATAPDGPWTRLTASPLAPSSYSATGLANGTAYWFAVAAVDATGNESARTVAVASTPRAPDTTAPPVPSGLTATRGDTTVALSWTAVAGTPDLAGYRVYRANAQAGPWTELTSSPLAQSSYLATALTNGTKYFFAVTAVDTTGNESARSVGVASTPTPPDTTAPPVPSGLAASAGDTSVFLSWSDSGGPSDLAGWFAYRATAPDGPWTKLTAEPLEESGYSATGLTNGTPYYFALTAIDYTGNESARTTAVAATPRAFGVAVKAPIPSGLPANADVRMGAVTCPAAGTCVATGDIRVGGAAYGLAEHLADGVWTPRTIPLPPDADPSMPEMHAVDCASASSCAAVGDYDGGEWLMPLLAAWDGTAWQSVDVAHAPGVAAGSHGELNGVSCPAVDFCVAAGWLAVDDGDADPLLVTWDGTAWTVRTGPETPGGGWFELADVDCPAAGWCVAAGERFIRGHGQPPFVEVLDAGVWTPALLAVPGGAPGVGYSEARGVSCVAVGECSYAGWYAAYLPNWGESVSHGLVETLSGGSWTALELVPPFAEEANEDYATDIVCLEPGRCDMSGEILGESMVAMAPSGTVLRSPVTQGESDASAIACVALDSCLAVGVRGDLGPDWQPLLELVHGSSVTAEQASFVESGDLELTDVAVQDASHYVAVGGYFIDDGYLLTDIPASGP